MLWEFCIPSITLQVDVLDDKHIPLILFQLVNREMFWVVTEVCSEHNLIKRAKTIKQFIKVASKCWGIIKNQ